MTTLGISWFLFELVIQMHAILPLLHSEHQPSHPFHSSLHSPYPFCGSPPSRCTLLSRAGPSRASRSASSSSSPHHQRQSSLRISSSRSWPLHPRRGQPAHV